MNCSHFFLICRRSNRGSSYSLFSIQLSCSLCADSRNMRHTTPFSLPMSARTPSMRWPCCCNNYRVLGWSSRRATRSTVYTVAAELRMKYEIKIYTVRTSTYELLLLLQQYRIYLATVHGTEMLSPWNHIFNFNDEVGMGGGHGNCCCFSTITGVHQGAHMFLGN